MKKIAFVFILLTIILGGCKLKENLYVDNYYAPVDNVTIIQIGQTLPDNIVRVGSISVGESGSTCYDITADFYRYKTKTE